MNTYHVHVTGEDTIEVDAPNSAVAEEEALKKFRTKYPSMIHIECVGFSKEV